MSALDLVVSCVGRCKAAYLEGDYESANQAIRGINLRLTRLAESIPGIDDKTAVENFLYAEENGSLYRDIADNLPRFYEGRFAREAATAIIIAEQKESLEGEIDSPETLIQRIRTEPEVVLPERSAYGERNRHEFKHLQDRLMKLLKKEKSLYPDLEYNDPKVEARLEKTNLYRFITGFLSENTNYRGGAKSIDSDAKMLIDFLERGNNARHIRWMNDVSGHYLQACVNQRVNGFVGLVSWVNIARKESVSEKISAASQLMVYNTVLEYVKKNSPGAGVEVEAANQLMIVLQKKLLKKHLINKGDWIGIPKSIAYGSLVGRWQKKSVSKHAEAILKEVSSRLDKDSLKSLLLDGMTGDIPNVRLWGDLAFEDVQQDRVFLEEQAKNKKEALDLLMDAQEDEKEGLYSKDDKIREEAIASLKVDKKFNKVEIDVGVIEEIRSYLDNELSELGPEENSMEYMETIGRLREQVDLGVENKLAQKTRENTDSEKQEQKSHASKVTKRSGFLSCVGW